MSTFDFDRSWFIVIERIIERGDILQWRSVQNYYGKEKMLEVCSESKQLSIRDKTFTSIYVNSEFNDPYRSTNY